MPDSGETIELIPPETREPLYDKRKRYACNPL